MVIGGLAIIVIIGEGLIYLFLGRESAIFGLVCILLVLSPVVIIAAILWLLEKWVKSVGDKD